ncbi:MAG: hypothetical protein GF421_06595 [Candidatus Aminicenantes bacterium]|nr:hypothetical protein [Candidatus Aminicenantes bacterium]
MKKIALGIFMMFLASLVFANVDTWQQDQSKPELQRQIIKVNYIRIETAYSVLRPYTSRYGNLQMLRDRNMLIIEDQPEFVEKILSILQEIDVKPLDIQITVDLILASKNKDTSFETEKNLQSDPIIKELMSMMNYQAFKHLDTSLIRVQDNTISSQRIGGSGIGLLLQLQPRHYKEEKKDLFQVELRLHQVEGTTEIGNIERSYSLKNPVKLIDTSLSIQSGQRSVVGVSKLNGGDLALILVIKGNIIQ